MIGLRRREAAKAAGRLHQPILYAVTIALAAALIGSGYWFYRQSLAQAVNFTTTSFMNQIADHDAQSIYNQISAQWNTLDKLLDRLATTRDEDLSDISYLMSVEAQASTFDKFFLVSESGTVHDSAYLTTTLDEERWADAYRSTRVRSVMRYDLDEPELWGEYLLYVVKLEKPVVCKGELIEGVVGLSPVGDIEKGMRFESFDGKGIAIVVQSTGDVVTASQYYRRADNENLFDSLKQATFLTGSYEQLLDSVARDTDAFIEYTIPDGRYYASIKPIEDSDWFIAVKVNYSVMADQVNELLMRSLIFFGVMAVLLGAVVTVIMRTVRDARVARESEKAKSTFLANMSHEIRTPLNGIVGLQYLMRQNLDDRERLCEYLDQADASAAFLKSIISDVLDMSKIESGQLDLYVQPFNLVSMARDIESLMMPQTRSRSLNLSVSLHAVDAPDVVGDEMRIKQVVVNLLGNAVKFTPEGGSISFSLSQEDRNGTIFTIMRVSDTGCGMSPEFIDRIWEPFEQEKRAGSQNGTGLGTALSKVLVDAMKGTIEVESTEGEGTTFTVTLPLPAFGGEPSARSLGNEDSVDTLEGTRVLVAEDNAVNRMVLVDILSDEGCIVAEAENGQAALDLFATSEEGSFDAILMDLQMPVMDGYQAAAAIRALPRSDASRIPILALTANAFRNDIARAHECGMNDVITKPLDVALLIEKLKVLGSSAPPTKGDRNEG